MESQYIKVFSLKVIILYLNTYLMISVAVTSEVSLGVSSRATGFAPEADHCS